MAARTGGKGFLGLVTPERKAELPVLRDKIAELWKRGKTRKEICAELSIDAKDYQNQVTYLRKKGRISYVQREKALIGTMPKLGEELPVSDATPEGVLLIQRKLMEKAAAIFAKAHHLAVNAKPENAEQIKVLGWWKDMYVAFIGRQVNMGGAPSGSGLTIVFNGVNRGPRAVQPVIEATATPVTTTEDA
jgi:hypothetical protein